MANEKTTYVKLGALWMRKMEDGTVILSGTLGDAQVRLFKNNNKSNPKAPDYDICVSPKKAAAPKPAKQESDEIPF